MLTAGVESDDPAIAGSVRQIIEKITGGRILVYQAGEPRRQRGWLKAAFTCNVVPVVAAHYGATVDEAPQEITVDLRETPIHVRIADEVKALWDEGLEYRQIARQVG